MLPRTISMAFQRDTNCINARNSLADINLLEQWTFNGVITIEMSEVAFNEARKGRNKNRIDKARRHIYTHTHASTVEEQDTLRKIQEIVFPDDIHDKSQANDVEIIFNAHKYGCILITEDGRSKRQPRGILGAAVQLEKLLGINVMSSNEAVEVVRERIRIRDDQCRRIAQEFNEKLPSWVGQD